MEMGEELPVLVGLELAPWRPPAGTASAVKESPLPEKVTSMLDPLWEADTLVGALALAGGEGVASGLAAARGSGVAAGVSGVSAADGEASLLPNGKLNWSRLRRAPASTLPELWKN